jgi:hypothetical protein
MAIQSSLIVFNMERNVIAWSNIVIKMWKVLFFVGINFRGFVKNDKFVDFVFVPKLKFVDFIFST